MLVSLARGLLVLPPLLLAMTAARAEDIPMQPAETRVFSLQVPAEWKVRGDGHSLLLAGGPRIVNGMPMPFLSAQYCVEQMMPEAVGLTACSDSCEQGAQKLLGELGKTMVLDKMESSRRGQTTEFRLLGKARSGEYAAMFALSCNPLGRTYISLASDGPTEALRAQFDFIMQTLQWRMSVAPEK